MSALFALMAAVLFIVFPAIAAVLGYQTVKQRMALREINKTNPEYAKNSERLVLTAR